MGMWNTVCTENCPCKWDLHLKGLLAALCSVRGGLGYRHVQLEAEQASLAFRGGWHLPSLWWLMFCVIRKTVALTSCAALLQAVLRSCCSASSPIGVARAMDGSNLPQGCDSSLQGLLLLGAWLISMSAGRSSAWCILTRGSGVAAGCHEGHTLLLLWRRTWLYLHHALCALTDNIFRLLYRRAQSSPGLVKSRYCSIPWLPQGDKKNAFQ